MVNRTACKEKLGEHQTKCSQALSPCCSCRTGLSGKAKLVGVVGLILSEQRQFTNEI